MFIKIEFIFNCCVVLINNLIPFPFKSRAELDLKFQPSSAASFFTLAGVGRFRLPNTASVVVRLYVR